MNGDDANPKGKQMNGAADKKIAGNKNFLVIGLVTGYLQSGENLKNFSGLRGIRGSVDVFLDR